MLVESGNTTILNTPQNICQTSPCVCSTYSSQQDTMHLIHQWLQSNRIKSWWWTLFPVPHLPNSLLEDRACYSHFANIEPVSTFHLQQLRSVYYCSMWAPLTGPREVLLSPGYDFHISFGVMGGGSMLPKVWGLSCTPRWQTLSAIFGLLLPVTPKQLAWPWIVFYQGKPP